MSRGDTVKDADGYLAVFSEHGTLASHMAAIKFLDAIARMADCDGADSDAVGAYMQVELCKIHHLMGKAPSSSIPGCRYPIANGRKSGSSLDILIQSSLFGETYTATSSQDFYGRSTQRKEFPSSVSSIALDKSAYMCTASNSYSFQFT